MARKKHTIPSHKAGTRRLTINYDYHLPVLINEIIEIMVTDESGLYIDGTLGGGGHTAQVLKKIDSRGSIYAFDKDPDAIRHCQRKFVDELSSANNRLNLINASYDSAYSIEELHSGVWGFLLDLGVSSKQLDDEKSGFSYRFETDLDMRFDPTSGGTARDLVHSATEEELSNIMFKYGEEPFSRRIAKRIVEYRRVSTIDTTFDLKKLIEEIVPQRTFTKTLSRVFQALRIAVNSELEVLENTLSNFVPLLKDGGRILIISYHSLEDRNVKNKFKELVGKNQHKNKYKPEEAKTSGFKLYNNKPILPTDEEIAMNPRARSAKLRILEKI